MQERQVTLEGTTRPLEPPFFVLATQNPIEYEGTYPLPEAQLDRFLVQHRDRLSVATDAERDILLERAARRSERIELETVCDRAGAARAAGGGRGGARRRASSSTPSRSRARRATRRSWPSAARRAGALAMMKLRARAAPLIAGRDFVTPDDVKAVSIPALAHRLTLAPELWVQRIDPAEAVRAAVASVPVPVLDESS